MLKTIEDSDYGLISGRCGFLFCIGDLGSHYFERSNDWVCDGSLRDLIDLNIEGCDLVWETPTLCSVWWMERYYGKSQRYDFVSRIGTTRDRGSGRIWKRRSWEMILYAKVCYGRRKSGIWALKSQYGFASFGRTWDPRLKNGDSYRLSQVLFIQDIGKKELSTLLTLHQIFILILSPRITFFVLSMSQGQWITRSEGKKAEGVLPVMRVKVPKFDNSARIAKYSKTLIGRCMNPQKQEMKSLLFLLPRFWSVEGRLTGTDLGMGRFQFDFVHEEDITDVLSKEPFHFDLWMISLVRWKPVLEVNYPSKIIFWVKVMDIPLQLWDEQTFRSIGEVLGTVLGEVYLEEGRVRVELDGFKPIIFSLAVDFEEGAEVMVSLTYDRLVGFCKECFMLTHEETKCPKLVRVVSETATDVDTRLTSYRGAVLNGAQGSGGFQGNHRSHQSRGGPRDKGKGIAMDRYGKNKPDRAPRERGEGSSLIGKHGERGNRGFDPHSRDTQQQSSGVEGLEVKKNPKLMADAFKGANGPLSKGHPAVGNVKASGSKARKSLNFDEAPVDGSTDLAPELLTVEAARFGSSPSNVEVSMVEGKKESMMDNPVMQDETLGTDDPIISDSEFLLEDGMDMEEWEQGEIPEIPEFPEMEEENQFTNLSEEGSVVTTLEDETKLDGTKVLKGQNGQNATEGNARKRGAQLLLSPRKQLLARALSKGGGKAQKKTSKPKNNPH